MLRLLCKVEARCHLVSEPQAEGESEGGERGGGSARFCALTSLSLSLSPSLLSLFLSLSACGCGLSIGASPTAVAKPEAVNLALHGVATRAVGEWGL